MRFGVAGRAQGLETANARHKEQQEQTYQEERQPAAVQLDSRAGSCDEHDRFGGLRGFCAIVCAILSTVLVCNYSYMFMR